VKGAGGLSNTGQINITGSASTTAKLVVTNTATSSGTIVIGYFAGSLGDLTAAKLDITGGTLEGFGTVTGALHVTGGTVVGGNFDSTPGTLSVSGSYSQSGSGRLQTDINTGSTPQSSIVGVKGGPGTPGAAGSVNLAGGTLLINAISSLAADTPYTVMTFGPHHLYGEFSQVETEGQLGNFTGNRTSVNLGNGNSLDVLYNEASGTIQVELVATPTRTTYDWDTGSGTWDTAADWNPPGNKTTPSSNSNVTIGTGKGGTVTLAQDETINSLTITSGYTLSGATHSITTNAGVSVGSGAALSLDDMNVGGVFTDMGSVTLAGVLTINTGTGGRLTLSNGSITGGGINGNGTFETNAGTTGTLKDLTIYGGTTYTASNGATTDISGAISDRGTIQVNGLLKLIGATTLSGGGVVSLSTKGGGSASIEGAGETLTNSADTIEGTGTIGNGSLALSNGGTIDADISRGTLTLNGTGGITNTGVFEATSGGILDVAGAFGGKGGNLEIGAGSEVELGGATSQDSTFLGASSAKLSIDNATKTTYGGVIHSFVSGDILELGSTDATKATPTKNGVDTTLTVDLSSGGPLTYTFAGDLTADTFSVTHVRGNSDIAIATTAAFGEAHSLLGNPTGSSFVDSSGLFGHSATHGFSEHTLAGWVYTRT
jgi:filamentous hemagglutinin